MATNLDEYFAEMRNAAAREPYPSLERRDSWLAAIEGILSNHSNDFCATITADFGWRSPHETRVLEILSSLEAVRFARKHLRNWMAPETREASRWFLTSSARVQYQPLGVVGIIVPWNYPLYLAVAPLVAALAAGNRVMLKPSEFSAQTGQLLQQLLADNFPQGEVRVVPGDVEVGRGFAQLPFDHLLFTGSTEVAKEVLKAAARNLTPVTLELGGKSPAIVAEGYSIPDAAERIVFGKCLNAGQTCVAPDYALVPLKALDSFLEEAGRAANKLYPDPVNGPDYTTIVSDRHFDRLMQWLGEAKQSGAQVLPLMAGLEPDRASRRFPVTAIVAAPDNCACMRQEIFGPLLPIVTYDILDDAINYVNRHPRPLALYYFDHDEKNIERILKETTTGGVTINDVLFHIAQEDLPFGGVGSSGMGRYHGQEGFRTFSNARAVLHQSPWAPARSLSPPYVGAVDKIIRYLTNRKR